ncbi:hypothetical protein CcaverHIS002_0204750 [Cutaneotrichosporon cavernicola]|uniref:Translation machinery-associated protein 16 n=1 Tax=Cutaneotrichosporon cavernicola TaxID=279322 RepID=A0AA48I0S2_9TREE|nr:uncharacterized protein CcaverHIS019_0204710 [Cutaneotrichosporon cavernicola]BEI81315.1 hypothetical protein CcaverHIS002_0204750 [Cutaneotrichosporon cavernicola]BEI89109.1 hypothetical protein CcaverHIS019_0204710 [Cutaneotrichosporon cavernicola]BEI96885.1 hypothetical protein CcaverHIS631_0204740 [Cutaneotrichosporon cavernicola]BEJ04657.1 hypothetical protein CcaverHIS641_0204740 [Cutaneotrichosporon cavernicola]
MPNNRKSTLKKIGGRDGVHPGSRKAAQINRVHLRTVKLKSQKREHKDLRTGKMFRPQFFMHTLEGPEGLTLAQLRALVTDVFLARNDERIEELMSERRAGRPKATELVDLEELRRVENAEWESGFEVPNLTDARATRLMYGWLENGTRIKSAHIDLLPMIRIAKDSPEVVVVSRKGKLDVMGLGEAGEAAAADMAVEEDEEEVMQE